MTETEALVLMLMSLGAFFMPFISKRLHLPSSVGEIMFGILIGALVDVHGEPMRLVEYFSAFGFLVLMYLAGLELNFDRFRLMPRKDLWLYLCMFAVVGIASFAATSYINLHWSFTLVFFTTGLGLLFPVLKDADLMKTDFGQNLLIMAMFGEILTLMGLTIVTLTHKYGFTVQSLLHSAYILGFFIVIYLIMRIMKVALWWHPSRQSLFLLVGNPTETGIRANFVILFFFVALASAVQIEPVVGAFIGGMLFALVFAGREAVLEKLGGVGYGFFIPIFFISVGMKFSISELTHPSVVLLALLITGVIFLTRAIGGAALFFTTIKKQKIILVVFGLSFPLTMLVAVSSICHEAGIISRAESSAVLIAAMASAILYPWLFKLTSAIVMPDINDLDK